jgi:hypothetical protein
MLNLGKSLNNLILTIMTLRKTGEIPVGPPKAKTQTKNNESPFFFEVDALIASRLKKKNLSFSIEKMEKRKVSIEAIISDFKDEILGRNRNTAGTFLKYCYMSLFDNFICTTTEKLFFESSDFATISLMSLGAQQALEGFGKIKEENINDLEFYEALPTLFTEEEFLKIIVYVKSLLSEFPEKTKKCYTWIVEHVEPKKQQEEALAGFIKDLQDRKDWSTDKFRADDNFKASAQKVLDTVLGQTERESGHSLFILQAREEIGILPPPKELMLSMDRILNYLDVLYYANFLTSLHEDPKELDFIKAF